MCVCVCVCVCVIKLSLWLFTVRSQDFTYHAKMQILSSPLAGKRDIVVTILVRCMCVRMYVSPSVRPSEFGPRGEKVPFETFFR